MLPADVQPYARTAEFTEATVPAGLLRAHTTKTGAWGLIRVLEGRLPTGSLTRAARPRRRCSRRRAARASWSPPSCMRWSRSARSGFSSSSCDV